MSATNENENKWALVKGKLGLIIILALGGAIAGFFFGHPAIGTLLGAVGGFVFYGGG